MHVHVEQDLCFSAEGSLASVESARKPEPPLSDCGAALLMRMRKGNRFGEGLGYFIIKKIKASTVTIINVQK